MYFCSRKLKIEACESASSLTESMTSMSISSSTTPTNLLGPGEVLKSSGKFSKPTRIPGKNYCKDEVVIRNADSGKGMLNCFFYSLVSNAWLTVKTATCFFFKFSICLFGNVLLMFLIVMGIKGRRVHMIEELSETIISFQRGKIVRMACGLLC